MRTNFRSLCTQAAAAAAGGLVVVALAGGSFAYAQEAPETGAGVAEVAAANSVNSAAIIDGSVKSADLRDGSVKSIDLLDGGVTSTDILDATVNSADISDGAVTGTDIANGSVTGSDVADGSIIGSDIGDGSINRADVASGVLTRWAKVDAGTTVSLLDGRGATTASRQGTGTYRVTFSSSIVGCGWTATLNDNDAGGSAPGEISVERASGVNSFDLFVRTYNSAGAAADTAQDDGFTVTVDC